MAGIKKIPMRQCIGCREMKSKKELIRVIRTPEQEIKIDATGKQNGRGAYICRNVLCLNKAIKCKALNRAFACEIPEEVTDLLVEELKTLEE